MYIIVLRTTKGGETMIGTLLRRISDWMVGEYQPKKEKTTEKKEEECVVVEGGNVRKARIPMFYRNNRDEFIFLINNNFFTDLNQPRRHD